MSRTVRVGGSVALLGLITAAAIAPGSGLTPNPQAFAAATDQHPPAGPGSAMHARGVQPRKIRPLPFPARDRVRAAKRFAASAGGLVSFAVIDSVGGVRGVRFNRQYGSASVSKALLLAAELRRLRRTKSPLDGHTAALLAFDDHQVRQQRRGRDLRAGR